MNDEQFETLVSNIAPENVQAFLLARDTAQREALAQMKSERDQYDELHLESIALASKRKAQLADVLYILDQHRAWTGMGWEQLPVPVHAVEKIRSKLAQAEQQEVPKRGKPDWNSHCYDQTFQTSDGNWFGARAGWDFKGHISDGWKGREVCLLRDDGGFLAYGEPNPDWENSLEQRPAQEAQGAQAGELQREDRYIVIKRKDLEKVPFGDRIEFQEALDVLVEHLPERKFLVIESDWPEYEPTWAAIQARVEGRAALATQPAVRKYVAPVSIATFEKAITEEALAAGFNEPDLRRHEVDGCEVYAQHHIQAAYSGWKLALGLAPAQQAIDLLVEALVAPNTADLPGRIDSFLDSQPAVRGAEHDQ